MSNENLETVRRIYTERLLDRDPKHLIDHFSGPDIEYVDPPDDVDPGSRRGRTDVLLALRRARQSFSKYRHGLQELFDVGDTVIAAVSFRSTTRGTTTRGKKREVIQKEEAHVWTFREGKIVRFENGRDLKDALEADESSDK